MTRETATYETVPRVLKMSSGTIALLQQHAQRAAPAECVGLLFGREDIVFRHVPLTNAAETPETRFYAEPTELLRALMDADKTGDTLLGVYHSHPQGPARLSEDDIQYAQPGLVQLLLTPERFSAFVVTDGVVEGVGLE